MGEFTKTVAELQSESFDFGLDTYPIFDSGYRAGLNSKILDHYKYHEICDEDSAVFKHYLNTAMNEIMSKYNQLYTSAALSYNPLLSFSKSETTTMTNTVETDGTSAGTQTRTNSTEETATTEAASNNAVKNTGKEISSDTPQGMLEANDINGNVWASNAKMSEANSTDTGTTQSETNSDRAENETQTASNTNNTTTTGTGSNSVVASGYDRPLAELVKLYRETFLNIDMMVIADLRDCFMLIF